MKNANMNDVLKKAMDDFGNAYLRLKTTIERYGWMTETSVNDLPYFTEEYPFDKSFDELAVDEWVSAVIANMPQPIDFKVLDYQYLNTGGNTMVGIHRVWLPEDKKVVYVYTNEEGSTISTVDYIRDELEVDDYDEFMIDVVDWGCITGYEKYFELYRYCYNQYLVDDCKYFGITHGVQYHLLSDELQKKIDVDYLVWLEAESDGLVRTDGKNIVEDPDYPTAEECKAAADDEKLQSIKAFKEWHNTLSDYDVREKMYEHSYTICIAGRTTHIPFDANSFNLIDALLSETIEEW